MGLFSDTLEQAQKKMKLAESIKRIDSEGYEVLVNQAKADLSAVEEWKSMSERLETLL